ncbi:amyloid-beta A4 precursor protein-binding family A member 1-like [Xenia sp. Carnegie-2017]|uniref:amyloid-beta A4 precursor protein-binding family A member 1-like n=1 Tax=Xenia sp. Carnegie-2017 TaxID=2897299 RepID=UPI001F036C16|nr:amyloid-beta A4 precursor protein-binding family A member 1-like [Xenia sp. Carnegie-2017]
MNYNHFLPLLPSHLHHLIKKNSSPESIQVRLSNLGPLVLIKSLQTGNTPKSLPRFGISAKNKRQKNLEVTQINATILKMVTAHPSKGKKAGSPMTHNPRPKAKPRDRTESPRDRAVHSSDAKFFKSRLSQTSKRYPNRHVWLVRDSEIHRMIAEKTTILRRHNKENGRKGKKFKGPNYSEVDVVGLPSVGFSGRTKDDSYRSSLPYDRHPSSRLSQSGYGARDSYEDEDERTDRLAGRGGKTGTFAVGLAARREQAEFSKSNVVDDFDDGCELCAVEAKEKERHEKKLKELEESAKAGPHHPRNLLLGIVYSAKFLGSTHLMSPSSPSKSIRLEQAQEAIGRIKVPEGDVQPSSDIDLFISTERIKIVSADKKQSLNDHHLKTISFIADIGNIIVVMARLDLEDESKTWSGKMPDFKPNKEKQEAKTTRVVCHVLQTSEAQIIAKSVGQAFSIAYHEFLKVNGLNLAEIEDMEYNGILEQQKILGEELSLLADESKTKEVVIHKKYGEALQIMIVETGWGSMVPTVVIAHMDNKGVAAKSGQLNVGNQILSVNGQSLVGLPLLECQNILRAQKYEERVALKIVLCPPTVEICINRPDIKYQLGFSVQNGMICSLMRGGIAERGGIRVGHKIIEMNGESVVTASHHHIVDILQTTTGELKMKTMPITLYKLLIGDEIPQYL